jgi:hypothetical protein
MWAEPRNKDTQKTGVFKSILGRVNKKKERITTHKEAELDKNIERT